MKVTYNAFFREESKWINVSFPDLQGCLTFGEGEEDARFMARDALEGHLLTLLDMGEDLPAPTPFSKLYPSEGKIVPITAELDINELKVPTESRRA